MADAAAAAAVAAGPPGPYMEGTKAPENGVFANKASFGGGEEVVLRRGRI